MTFHEHRTILVSDTPGDAPPRRNGPVITALAGIEMWERFSFYGMQAILVYFLYHATELGGLGLDPATATAAIGAYGALVYLCTIAGGWIADRVLGPEHTLLGGAALLMVGHLTMGSAGSTGSAGSAQSELWVAAALLLIAAGSGALKASAVAVLGRASTCGDAGFLVFYLGINVGAFLGPLLTGWLQHRLGFRAGFTAAAVLMAFGLLTYLALRRRYLAQLGPDDRRAVLTPGEPAGRRLTLTVVALATVVLAAVGAAVASGRLSMPALAGCLLVTVVVIAVLTFRSMLRDTRTTPREHRDILDFIPLFIASSVFWSILNQNFGVLAVYSDIRLDRTLFGWEVPASWTQSLNPVFMLILIPLTGLIWSRRRGPSADAAPPLTRMTAGVTLAGIGMLLFLPFAGGADRSTPLLVLAAAVLLITAGEINVGPVGMAAAGTLAPSRFAVRFSALYFLSMAVGTSAAGVASRFYVPGNPSAERLYFLGCATVAVGTAFLLRRVGRRRWHRGCSETRIR